MADRRAISLTEVLIAMGILTVGLLGVASVFPVAGHFMQQGEVADRASAIAQAAFNHAVTSGQLDPAGWWSMTRNYREPTANRVPGVDGMPNTFSRPVYNALQAAKAAWPASAACQRIGSVYVIDPRGAASLSNYAEPYFPQTIARGFPITSLTVNLRDFYSPSWLTWTGGPNAHWPIRRVTFRQPLLSPHQSNPDEIYPNTTPFNRALADATFMSSDDLSLDVPPQADRPSRQLLTSVSTGSTMQALARQSQGNYSWLFTVVPQDQYDLYDAPAEVSAVVFYKRPLDFDPPETNEESLTAAAAERMVKASVVSTGLSGGEVLLTPVNDAISESPFKSLRVGRWIMLCGPHPASTDSSPKFVARWYRVLSIETEGSGRLVTLRGPHWPWEPQTGGNTLSNNLCAGIFPGAVAVHSRTIRLGGGGEAYASGGVVGGAVPSGWINH